MASLKNLKWLHLLLYVDAVSELLSGEIVM